VKRLKWLHFALAACLVLALSACGSGGSGKSDSQTQNNNQTGSSDSEAPSGDSAPKGKTELVFWSPFSGPDGPFMKKIVDAYNEQSDSYQVKFQIQPNGDYYKLLDNAFGTKKNMPDLMIMHLDTIPTYAGKDLLQPMDDLAAKAGIQKSDYVDAAVNYATIDGKWWGIPSTSIR
jgi:multiple sugar transport system substrate-binding protein